MEHRYQGNRKTAARDGKTDKGGSRKAIVSGVAADRRLRGLANEGLAVRETGTSAADRGGRRTTYRVKH